VGSEEEFVDVGAIVVVEAGEQIELVASALADRRR
jgi:hypothetical protein